MILLHYADTPLIGSSFRIPMTVVGGEESFGRKEAIIGETFLID